MLRAMGAILLLSGSAGLGLAAVRRLERRVTALRSLTVALDLMERELDFRLPPMKELILETARRSAEPASGFLRTCGERMNELEGRPLSGLWRQAAVEKLPTLKKCELEILFSVGAVLADTTERGSAAPSPRHGKGFPVFCLRPPKNGAGRAGCTQR